MNYKSDIEQNIVVLGGIANYSIDINRVSFRGQVDRLMQALVLHQNRDSSNLFIVGGSGDLYFQQYKESISIQNYLKEIGFKDNIYIETESRNTYENARNFAKQYNMQGQKIILVTSALHMRRASACFRKQEVEVVPYSTNRVFGDEERIMFWNEIIPSLSALQLWSVYFREIIGYTVYRLKSYC